LPHLRRLIGEKFKEILVITVGAVKLSPRQLLLLDPFASVVGIACAIIDLITPFA
jgi:hypothetical protein